MSRHHLPLRSIRHVLRLTRVLLSSQYALMLEFRAEIVLWALSGVSPLIMLGLWSGSGVVPIAGFTSQRLVHYFLAAFVVRQFTIVWVIHAFEEDALQGRLSPALLQPLHPFWRYLAAHVSEQVTRLPFVLAIVGMVALLHQAALWWPPPAALLLAFLATQLAFLVRFAIQSALTMLCFWSERAAALERLLLIPYLFLSGLVAPLEAFPEPIRDFALHTPFPWMVWFPAQLLSGGAVPVLQGFGVLAGWGLVFVPIAALLWRAGLRRYSAMGA
ncbi:MULTISPECIES: ABC-2 family transporter protein [unclassified Synechococcus]|uniref:ABC transporter permease n=1 Tax=unclassified Synechococcus TaxID=2626047 RepID=UPI0021A280EE|nr:MULTISPECIES: ABC-2 family transporter protein [unclassified Synechococcus]